MFVEVLDEAGQPCKPSQVGRVVITSLHNYAMPLIRYEIGDFAEQGRFCDCGRGLPVLNRIVGRQRNMVCLPDGTRHWPSFDPPGVEQADLSDLLPIRQYQAIQRSLEEVELLVVLRRPMLDYEQELLSQWVASALGHPFQIRVTCVDEIPRAANGKYEDFRCEVNVNPGG